MQNWMKKILILFKTIIAFCAFVLAVQFVFLLITHDSIMMENIQFWTTAPIEPAPSESCGYLVRLPSLGRLGNQMFVYASFYGLYKTQLQYARKKPTLRRQGEGPLLDSIFENLTITRNPNSSVNSNSTLIKEKICCGYDNSGLSNLSCDGRDIHISGYRQSFKYFRHVIDEIKREFKFTLSIREKCQKIFNDSLSEKALNNCTTVGVHLRRGDMLLAANGGLGYLAADLEYFKRAVRYQEQSFFGNGSNRCLAFLVFGDDYAWNTNAIKQIQLLRPQNTHFVVIKSHEAAVDMCVLAKCQHISISVGTFGWWAAFFVNGIVTYQKEFAKNGTSMDIWTIREDVFFPHWVGL